MVKTIHRITIPIEGMTCAACVSTVSGAISKVPGVSSANVNLATETAWIEFDPMETGISTLLDAVNTSGYRTSQQDATIGVLNLADAGAAAQIESRIRAVQGVINVVANPLGIFHLWQFRSIWWHECPMPIILRPLRTRFQPLRELRAIFVMKHAV